MKPTTKSRGRWEYLQWLQNDLNNKVNIKQEIEVFKKRQPLHILILKVFSL